jgi:DNA repair protein RadC
MKIKNWAKEERPREKLEDTGPASLTNVELLAVLLGTGTSTEHVLDVAKKMLDTVENSVARLVALSIKDLMNMHGIGHAKAVKIKAVMELARRTHFEDIPKNFKVGTSQDAFRVLAPNLGGLSHEEFWMLALNRRSKFIGKKKVSQGGLTSTVADPRIIFKWAFDMEATSIIVAHNHPSGSLNPSQADIDLTKKLAGGAKILDIQLVDHLIISGNNYCSFADSGLL